MPLILFLFTIMCALPAAGVAVIPSAIAQEDNDMSLDEAENLASDTVSNVLDNDNTAGDNSNTQVSVPLIDQDQTDANFGLSEALDVTVERTLSTPTTPPPSDDDGELPPPPPIPTEFCLTVEFVSTVVQTYCFSTGEECETGEEILRGSFAFARILSSCEGFETLPAGGQQCEVASFVDPDSGLLMRNISCPRG